MSAMQKRRTLLARLALLLALLAGTLYPAAFRAHEPLFQGKTLNEWFASLGPGDVVIMPDPQATAIRAMGTNAIPFLLQWITCQPRPWQHRLANFSANTLHWNSFQQHLQFKEARAQTAMRAFEVLGHQARCAKPALIKLMSTTKVPETAYRAHYALDALQDDDLATFTAIFTNRFELERYYSLSMFRRMDTNALPALPLLLERIRDTNEAPAVTYRAMLIQRQHPPARAGPFPGAPSAPPPRPRVPPALEWP
jgi:hypothetical protein